MISYKHRYIFTHIPKAGGHSLKNALRDIEFPNNPKAPLQWLPLHFTLAETKNVFSDSFFNECFRFAVSRNPYDRLVSAYHWHQLISSAQRNDPNSFLNKEYPQHPHLPPLPLFLRRFHTFDPFIFLHFQHQRTFTHLGNENLCTHVYRFEDGLDSIITDVTTRLQHRSCPLRTTCGYHAHKADYEKKPITERLDVESISIISEIYREDFEAFGYPIL